MKLIALIVVALFLVGCNFDDSHPDNIQPPQVFNENNQQLSAEAVGMLANCHDADRRILNYLELAREVDGVAVVISRILASGSPSHIKFTEAKLLMTVFDDSVVDSNEIRVYCVMAVLEFYGVGMAQADMMRM